MIGEGMEEAEAASFDGEEEGVLDLTSAQLHDLSEVELSDTLKELDLTANRLSVLDERIWRMSQLRKLSLRQNLFTDDSLSALANLAAIAHLQELVLRDNKLTRIPFLGGFTSLCILDVSYNELPSLEGLAKVSPTLHELYLSRNEINKIEELGHLHNLSVLELGSNRIRVMEGLQNLTKLQELWLGRNRVKAVDLCGLKCLSKISLQSNRLTSMLGFQDCVCLEELYLSHNGIWRMEGLSTLVNLRVLDVSCNRIPSIDDVSRLTRYSLSRILCKHFTHLSPDVMHFD
eukprot:c25325_g1_i3 orf=1098-1964(-)